MRRRNLTCQTAALLGAAGILLTVYVILAIDASHHQFLPLDRNVREWVQPIRSGGLDLSMETVSLLGAPAGLVPLILIASAVLWRASRRWALLLPILMAGTGALQLAGKWAADRPRPNAAPWGFPSGHVLSLVVFFGVMAFLLITLSERRRRVRVLACFSCGAVVGLVAVSRIYLDMHWLSDVIGGFTLGSAYLLIALWASQLIFAARPAAAVAELGRGNPARLTTPRSDRAWWIAIGNGGSGHDDHRDARDVEGRQRAGMGRGHARTARLGERAAGLDLHSASDPERWDEQARHHRYVGDSRRLGGLAQGSSVRRDARATGRTRSGPEAGMVA